MTLAELQSFDAYAPSIASALCEVGEAVAKLAERFTADFYDALASAAQTAQVLARLNEAEFARLKRRQAQHFMTLLDPDLTALGHSAVAERAGRAHALVGVDVLWLIEAFNLYEEQIHQLLRQIIPQAQRREVLMRIVSSRILTELHGQAAAYRRLEAEVASAAAQIDREALSESNVPDLLRAVMATIGGLDGDLSLFFARVDATGALQIEAAFGSAAEHYQLAMENGALPKIAIDPLRPEGQGPAGRAWRTGQIVTSDSWASDPTVRPWQHVGSQLGFRAGAAVPLVNASGQSIALLSLYSPWPGYFSTMRISGFLNHFQKVLSYAMQQRTQGPVVPVREQQMYQRLLNKQRLVMLYQPIISLQDGRLRKVEALARLRADDGELIPPERFLPTLGSHELLQVFEQGLLQACEDCRSWELLGLRTQVAINFPAEGLGDARYEAILLATLARSGLGAERLQLELLETDDTAGHPEQRRAFIRKLRDIGIQMAQDDLGSGHSSLLRMDRYGFDEVKIDQSLVQGARQRPQRALEFILYLTRLAHAFKTPVTVEGLETLGLIEAAAILGADQGQGFGIARPMRATQLATWHQGYVYPVDAQNPRTAVGAMAGYLLWDSQLGAITDRPRLVEEFAGGKSIVDRFIALNQLQGSELDSLLRQSRALALGGSKSSVYQRTRAMLMDALKDYWLAAGPHERA